MLCKDVRPVNLEATEQLNSLIIHSCKTKEGPYGTCTQFFIHKGWV